MGRKKKAISIIVMVIELLKTIIASVFIELNCPFLVWIVFASIMNCTFIYRSIYLGMLTDLGLLVDKKPD